MKFTKEEQAEKALKALAGRFYAGRVIAPEYCPVTDLADARCRQYDDAQCSRGGFCNFIHWKHVPKAVKKRLYRRFYAEHPEYSHEPDDRRKDRREERKPSRRSRSRSKDRKSRRDRSEDRRANIDKWNRETLVDEDQL